MVPRQSRETGSPVRPRRTCRKRPLGLRGLKRGGVLQAEPADGDLEAVLHAGIVGVEVPGEDAVLELQAVGILEVDGLGPVVVDDVRYLDALGDQLVPLLVQSRLPARL